MKREENGNNPKSPGAKKKEREQKPLRWLLTLKSPNKPNKIAKMKGGRKKEGPDESVAPDKT